MEKKNIFDTIRIVHTDVLWQDSDRHCNITVYDEYNNIITEGHDIIQISGESFFIETIKDVAGFFYYGAKFEIDGLHHNTLKIKVT
jgi:hypothetical protein